MLLTRVTSIYSLIKEQKSNHKHYVILIDEPELHLHPERSEKYIKLLINYFWPMTSLWYKFHFIIATHNPSIVSDIPLENIVFLEKWKQVDIKEWETFWNTTYNIVSKFLMGDSNTLWEFTKEIIEWYKGKIKPLLWYIYYCEMLWVKRNKQQRERISISLSTEFKDIDDYSISNINKIIDSIHKEYDLIISNIWDRFLREYLLWMK
jgi:predicted ATP-binding protein involved in virulence